MKSIIQPGKYDTNYTKNAMCGKVFELEMDEISA